MSTFIFFLGDLVMNFIQIFDITVRICCCSKYEEATKLPKSAREAREATKVTEYAEKVQARKKEKRIIFVYIISCTGATIHTNVNVICKEIK